MTITSNNDAFSALREIRTKYPDIQLKVLTIDDVLSTNDWPDTPANRDHIRNSYEWRKWDEMKESDWDSLAMMDDAPDAGSYEDGEEV